MKITEIDGGERLLAEVEVEALTRKKNYLDILFLKLLKWAGTAKSGDNGRPILMNYIICENAIYCADGMRIHKLSWKKEMEGFHFPAGAYSIQFIGGMLVLKKADPSSGKIPDFEQIMKRPDTNPDAHPENWVPMVAFNPKFVRDACNIPRDGYPFPMKMYLFAENRIIFYEASYEDGFEVKAAVMPMHL